MEAGERIGDYIIDGFLASGGMGEVYAGHHAHFERQKVVLKCIHRHFLSKETIIRRFEREAAIQAPLAHPFIVPVKDFVMYKGAPVLILEFVAGTTLRELIDRDGRMPAGRALALLDQILKALEYAWEEHRILHRDIKPENIFVTPQGDARIGDFGIATIIGEDGMTKTGEVLGTPQYMSPDQILDPKRGHWLVIK